MEGHLRSRGALKPDTQPPAPPRSHRYPYRPCLDLPVVQKTTPLQSECLH